MNTPDIIISVYPFVVTFLYLCTFAVALFAYFSRAFMLYTNNKRLNTFLYGPIYAPGKGRKHMEKIILHVFFAFLLSRILILLIGQIGFWMKGNPTGLIDYRRFIFCQWDAPHYIGIAENGYVNEGDARLHIVFYPLFPFLIRLINALTGDSLVSAGIIANVCLIAGGVFLYLVCDETYGGKEARNAVLLFMFSMGSVFYSVPYTESLFFLLTIACVYFARKRRFWLSLILGSLCSLTRLPGAITAVCVFFEYIRSRLGFIRRIGEDGSRLKRAFLVSGSAFARCLFILTGFLIYLIINKAVTGDPFRFLEYQKNHWGQEAGNIYQTAEYSIRYLFYPFEKWYQLGVHLPQCAAILMSVLILFFVKKNAHPSDLAYSVVYFFVTLSPTMVISGPRYLSAMYPLYPFAAVLLNRNRFTKIMIPIIWALFFVYSSYMYLVEWTYL